MTNRSNNDHGLRKPLQTVCALRAVATTAVLFVASVGAYANGPLIDLWYGQTQYFGDIGSPQRWINVLGSVTDSDGVASLSYSLNGNPAESLSIGPDSRRLSDLGDFNVEIDRAELLQGMNLVEVTATDTLGNATSESVNLIYDGTTLWPNNFSTDWAGSSVISDTAQVVDGKWSLVTTGVRTDQLGYDRVIAIGDELSWSSYEATVPITVHGIDLAGYNPISVAPGVGIMNRWKGHTTLNVGEQPSVYWLPSGTTAWYHFGDESFLLDAGTSFTKYDNSGLTLDIGGSYIWKLRVQELPDGETYHAFKIWKETEPEPSEWLLSGFYNPPNINETGSLIIYPHHVDATIGEIDVVNLVDDDMPPIIDAVEIESQQDGVTVVWSTNEPSTTLIEYGLNQGYGLGSISQSGFRTDHSVYLPNLTTNTVYHFRIVASDSNSNTVISDDYQFTFVPKEGIDIISDDFSDVVLDTGVWTFIDEIGDVTLSMTGTQVQMDIPGVSTYRDFWTDSVVNNMPRLIQSVSDEDFEVEAKFESPMNANYQIQGITVEEDSLNLMRIEFLYIGSTLNLYAASFLNGSVDQHAYQPISASAPMYLRVNRTGDQWTVSISDDGTGWSTVTTFDQPMTVSAVGVYATGSPGTPHTAIIDYFFNTAAPIVPEDGSGDVIAPSVPGDLTGVALSSTAVELSWTASTDNVGVTGYEISRDGVVITTVVSPGYTDSGLEASTTYGYEVVALDAAGNRSAVAAVSVATQAASPDTQAPSVPGGLTGVALSSTAVELSWTASTDNVGVTGYEISRDGVVITTVVSPEYTDSDLEASTTYGYEVVALDAAGNRSAAAAVSVSTNAAPSVVLSDDFSDVVLDTGVWTFIDEIGDVTLSMTGTQVQMDIPGVSTYRDFWTDSVVNNMPRLIQSVSDEDFEVEAKFESPMNANYQIQGITVEEDSLNLMRIEFLYIGSTLNLYAASFLNGSVDQHAYQPISASAPMYLRVNRTGDQWTVSISDDGTGWSTVTTFDQPMTVSAVGVYATGSPGTPHTAIIDYFFNTAAPIVPEDGSGDVIAPSVPGDLTGVALSSTAVELSWTASTDNVGVTGYEISRDGVVITTVVSPGYTDSGLEASTTYGYEVVALDAAGNRSAVAAVSVATQAASPDTQAPSVPGGLTGVALSSTAVELSWTASTDNVGVTGYEISRDGVVITTVVSPEYTDSDLEASTTYGYEVVALDAAGNRSAAAAVSVSTNAAPSVVLSDDFSDVVLDTGVWTFIDEIGDVTLSMTGTQVQMDIPGVSTYRDFWTDSVVNNMPRLIQSVSDEDFEVEAKFESPMNANYQIQGITVEEDSLNLMRIEFLYIGSTLNLYAASFLNGSVDQHAYQPISASAPMYLRVNRTGDQWTVSISDDGTGWSTVTTFDQPMTVSAVGVYATGSPGTPHTAIIDYFFNTAAPIVPEN